MIAFAMQQVIIPTPKKYIMILKDNYLSITVSSSVELFYWKTMLDSQDVMNRCSTDGDFRYLLLVVMNLTNVCYMIR